MDAAQQSSPANPQHLTGIPLALVIFGLLLSVFCLGLDRSIIATAIPQITNDFDSLEDVAWYGSAYLLTTCSFQLIFGKFYAEYKVNWVYLIALAIFEIGSLICGCAPNSVALIIGRAIQGVGCAGVMTGALVIITKSLPLHKRPMYTGLIGGISGVAQIVAPTLGGVLTDRASWRWCFWINLPLGAATAGVVVLFARLPQTQAASAAKRNQSPWSFIQRLDLLGTALLMPWMVCLLLALEWGGTTYAWDNWRIILCLCLFAVLFLVWVYVQHVKGDAATLPLRIMKERSVSAGMLFMLGRSGSLFVVVYYVPIWFQSVKQESAEQSGINFLTASAAMTVASITSGTLTTKIGYYIPQMLCSVVLTSIAAGLIYEYNVNTSTAYWAGTLVMFGFGAGLGMQIPITAVQTILKGADIAIATSVLVLAQTLGASVFLAVAQNLFQNELVTGLADHAPTVDPAVVVSNGVSGLVTVIQDKYGSAAVPGVLQAYSFALRKCFLLCLVLSCVTIFGVVSMESRNVKKESAREAKEASESTVALQHGQRQG
ncbi:MFS general substrate transporter [Periconia macrospinosa]|uniref:MFS general substrate transporter n=1 Tax=Periconia macrospinosa TaxID=97972 RepID=A0A2V1D136_9PLEO|nr:MFS general substrate transporter [Periconia macrospinosa]